MRIQRAVGVVLLLVVGACSSSSHSSAPTTTAPTTTTTSGATTTEVPSTAPTTAPGRDPLPAGTVMLGARGGSIVALDAGGHALKTLLTVATGRLVTGTQLMPDHETLWYVTTGNPAVRNRGCPSVVRLNLRTNTTALIAHATGVAVTADGKRYVLGPGVYSDASGRNGCPGASFEDQFAVHDVATGVVWHAPDSSAPIASSGPLGVAISPAGNLLITSQCSLDGCSVMTLPVPESAGAPLTWHTTSPVSCDCLHFVTDGDALYAVVQTPMAPRAEVRRFAWNALSGTGTTVFSSSSPRQFGSPVPTTAGVYAFVGDEFSEKTSHLYRLSGGRATAIGASGYAAVVGVPRFAPRAG